MRLEEVPVVTYDDLNQEQKEQLVNLARRMVYPASPDLDPISIETNPVLDSIPYHLVYQAVAERMVKMYAQAVPGGMWRGWRIRGFTLWKETYDNGQTYCWVVETHGSQADDDRDELYTWNRDMGVKK